jgi:glycerol-3-phosphate dehydrogenase
LNRQQHISKLQNETFDVCIIGAGATGAGCALDAALRGLKVVLIDKEDFAAATSSKSTKLIHGGVRYLEQAVKKMSWAQFKMVKKALKERRTLLKIAPHITHPLPLLTPCFSLLEGWYYAIGLKIYDWISGNKNIGKSKWLSKPLALKRISTLKKDKIASAVLYWDGQLDDLRFALALVQTAAANGAVVVNHMAATNFTYQANGLLDALQVIDGLAQKKYTIKAKQYINATGPFADAIRLQANAQLPPRIKVSKGIHITLPKHFMPGHTAMLIPKTDDGRLIFVIPYQNELLVGTTDDACELTEATIAPSLQEINYLLGYLNRYLNVTIKPSDITSGFGGLRPLLMAAPNASTKELVRDHEVEVDATTGLVSIMGGKWTTYRLMAKDTIDVVEKAIKNTISNCTTSNKILIGALNFNAAKQLKTMQLQSGWSNQILLHLLHKYGTEATTILQLAHTNPALQNMLLPNQPYTYAELQYVIQYEMAYTVKDVVDRRWGLALINWQKSATIIPIVGAYMAKHFGWTIDEQAKYTTNYLQEIIAMKQLLDS